MTSGRLTLFIAALVLLSFIGAAMFWQGQRRSESIPFPEEPPTHAAVSSPTPTPVPSVLALETAVGQRLAVSLLLRNFSLGTGESHLSTPQKAALLRIQPRIVVLYGRSIPFEVAQQVSEELHALDLPIPLLVAVDHEGGRVQRLLGPGFTPLASWQDLCSASTLDRESAYRKTAEELQTAGIDMVLGPVVDFSGRTQPESRWCVGEADQVLESTAQVLRIYEQHRILPTLKHFPGIGSVTVDLHDRYMQTTNIDQEQSLFRTLLEKFPEIAVMTAPAGLPNEDIPCTLSERCIGLLEEFPQTLIITDDVYMKALHTGDRTDSTESLAELSLRALNAGADVVLLGPDISLTQAEEIKANVIQESSQSAFLQKSTTLPREY